MDVVVDDRLANQEPGVGSTEGRSLLVQQPDLGPGPHTVVGQHAHLSRDFALAWHDALVEASFRQEPFVRAEDTYLDAGFPRRVMCVRERARYRQRPSRLDGFGGQPQSRHRKW